VARHHRAGIGRSIPGRHPQQGLREPAAGSRPARMTARKAAPGQPVRRRCRADLVSSSASWSRSRSDRPERSCSSKAIAASRRRRKQRVARGGELRPRGCGGSPIPAPLSQAGRLHRVQVVGEGGALDADRAGQLALAGRWPALEREQHEPLSAVTRPLRPARRRRPGWPAFATWARCRPIGWRTGRGQWRRLAYY